MVLVTRLAHNVEHWKCLVADVFFLSQEGLATFTRKDLYNIKLKVVVEKLTLGKTKQKKTKTHLGPLPPPTLPTLAPPTQYPSP